MTADLGGRAAPRSSGRFDLIVAAHLLGELFVDRPLDERIDARARRVRAWTRSAAGAGRNGRPGRAGAARDVARAARRARPAAGAAAWTSSRPASGRAPARRWRASATGATTPLAGPPSRAGRLQLPGRCATGWTPRPGPAALPRRQRSAAREGPPEALRLRPGRPPRLRPPRPPRSAAERRLRRARPRRRRRDQRARAPPRRTRRRRAVDGTRPARARALTARPRRRRPKSFTIVPSKDPHALPLSRRSGRPPGRSPPSPSRCWSSSRSCGRSSTPPSAGASRPASSSRAPTWSMVLAFGLLAPAAARARRSTTGCGCWRCCCSASRVVIAASLLLFDVVLRRARDPAHPARPRAGGRLLHHRRDRADPLGRRRHARVHGVGADDGGHRPRAAGHAGQRHGRPGAAAGARLRGRRLDQPRRPRVADRRPHPRGALARHDDHHQERRPDADPELGDHARA